MIQQADRAALLEIARNAVRAQVTGAPATDAVMSAALSRRVGAFVSAYVTGALRGCIGHIETDTSLADVVAQCARAACAADPRFAPVTAEELPGLSLELSVLGPFERVLTLDDVEIGAHGLLAEEGARRGLLLPQVAVTWHWDARQFAEETCHKAGLSPGAWERDALLWRFRAEVFAAPFAVSGE